LFTASFATGFISIRIRRKISLKRKRRITALEMEKEENFELIVGVISPI